MTTPNLIRAIAGIDGFRVTIARRARFTGAVQYHLLYDGDRFPLAGGDMNFIRRHFDALASARLRADTRQRAALP